MLAQRLPVRPKPGGKLKVEENTQLDELRLPEDEGFPGIDLTGFNDNYWLGLSIFHTVFTLEHNAICEHGVLDEERRPGNVDSGNRRPDFVSDVLNSI